jgi:TldD protein
MDPRDLIPDFSAAVARLERDAPFASAYARRNGGTSVRVDSLSTAADPIAPNAGFTLTAWTGERFLELSSDELSPSSIAAAAERLAAKVRAAPPPRDGLVLDPGEPSERHFAQTMGMDSRAVPIPEKLALARALRERLAAPGAKLKEAIAVVGDVHADVVYVNRARRLSQELHRVRQVGVGVFADGAAQVRLHGGFERIGGWEHQGVEQPYLDELRRDGPRLLGAPRLPDPGEHDCVFDGAFAGIFAHEAFGHGTEQDMFLKDRAKGAEYLGKPVASPLVTMLDDPANGWAASYFFDDEGVLAAPTLIVDRGTLVAGINDRYSAAALGGRGLAVAKTANGRREAYDHKPYTRMTNTFFGPGDSDVAAMIGSVARGYYLRHPSNGMEDPKGWGIQLEGAFAEEIRDGRLTGRVFSPVVVTGSVPRLLESVTMVGREVEEASLGMCGKGYKEWVKVTDGGPHLRLRAVLA